MRLRTEEESPFSKVLANILILCALTFIAYTFYQDHEKLVVAGHWIPIQAIIKGENVYVSEAVPRKSGHSREDCITVSTTYAFKDSSYEKNFMIDCKESVSKESDVQVEQQLRQIYPINSKVGIRFNPQLPEQAMTDVEFQALSESDHRVGNTFNDLLKVFGITVICYLVFFVVVGLPLFFYLKGGKKPPNIFDYEP